MSNSERIGAVIFDYANGAKKIREATISYQSLLQLSYDALKYSPRRNMTTRWQDLTVVQSLWHYLINYSLFVSVVDILLVVCLAFLFTTLRLRITRSVFLPFSSWCKLKKADREKVPEAAWKLTYYSLAWILSLWVVVFSGRYSFFRDPLTVWEGWYIGVPVPMDIYVIYLVQFSFYLHSFYATLHLDQIRKDTPAMIIHHFLTLSLLGFSFLARHFAIGTLVLLLHDIADICLQLTKICVYFKNRGGPSARLFDVLSAVGFLSFAVSWFVCRLYWFPLKVLYASWYGAIVSLPPEIPFITGFNILLWCLLGLNTYWFHFILVALYKVARGQMITDTREIEESTDEDDATSVPSKKDQTTCNGFTAPTSHFEMNGLLLTDARVRHRGVIKQDDQQE